MKKLFTIFIFLLILSPLQVKAAIADDVSGKILLQVEKNGEAWYINPANKLRYYMGRPEDAYYLMRSLGLGITNDDIKKIPIGFLSGFGRDSDKDSLSDALEDAIGTNKMNSDSDGDGYTDDTEINNNFNPLGTGKLPIDSTLTARLQGKILLQVEQHGEAWYINPTENKRYYLGRAMDAFQIMRDFGLGITNNNLSQIKEYIPPPPTGKPSLSVIVAPQIGTYEDTPRADVVLGGWQVVMVRHVFSALNENFTIKSLQIRLTDIITARSISQVQIAYKDLAGTWGGVRGTLTNGILTFTNLNIPVIANREVEVTINATFNSISAGATSGDILRLCLDNGKSDCSGAGKLVNFLATSDFTKTNITELEIDNTRVINQIYRKTRLYFTTNPKPQLINANGSSTIIGKYAMGDSLGSDEEGETTIKQITLQLIGDFIVTNIGDNQVAVNIYQSSRADRGEHLMGTGIITGVDGGTSLPTTITLTKNNLMNSSSFWLIIEADTMDTDFISTPANANLKCQLNMWQWDDGTPEGTAATPARGFPVIYENILTF